MADAHHTCDGCHAVIEDYSGVGYDGPADQSRKPTPDNDACDPNMMWVTLCTKCASDQLEAEG